MTFLTPKPTGTTKALRDFALFIVGMGILWHEVFVVDSSEPWVLAVGVAFCVSPGTIHLDKIVSRLLGGDGRDDKESSS